jgi:hypothetical protein
LNAHIPLYRKPTTVVVVVAQAAALREALPVASVSKPRCHRYRRRPQATSAGLYTPPANRPAPAYPDSDPCRSKL